MRPVIIGSGIGGLAIGIILKKNGYNPVIFEKRNYYGGSFTSYKVKDYKVDSGLHMLTRGTTGELPVLMKKYIDPEVFQKNFVEQKAYEFHLREKYDKIPGNLRELLGFRILNMKARLSFLRLFLNFLRTTRNKSDFDGSSYDYSKKFISNDDMLYFLNAVSWMCNGCSIKDGSLPRFIDTFVRQKELSMDYIIENLSKGRALEQDWYPLGGLKNVPELFVKEGLDVRLNTNVDEIIVEGGKVTGVRIGRRVFRTDMVIYDGLMKDLPKLTNNKVDIALPKQDEYYAITIWLGFNKKIADWNRVSRVRVRESMDSPHWGVFVSDFDPSLAPKGHQLFGMSAILHKDRDEQIKEMKQSIEEFLPGHRDHVDMEHIQIVRAEKTLQKKGNNIFTLPEQKTNINGLYVVGTDTKGWGSGGTLCADSANRCWEFIRNDYKH